MNNKMAYTEMKIGNFIRQHELEWLVVCGLKPCSYTDMPEILQLLRNEGLCELEAMMIWKTEYLEFNNMKEQ